MQTGTRLSRQPRTDRSYDRPSSRRQISENEEVFLCFFNVIYNFRLRDDEDSIPSKAARGADAIRSEGVASRRAANEDLPFIERIARDVLLEITGKTARAIEGDRAHSSLGQIPAFAESRHPRTCLLG